MSLSHGLDHRPRPRRDGTTVCALLILVSVALLRAQDLGTNGLWIDEDLTSLAVDGVLETGVPTHPSGGVYLRAPLYTYACAAAAKTLGNSESSLRIPSLVIGIAGLWIVFRFARDIGGNSVGLAVLVVLSLSGWDAFYSRMARMYSATIVLFTLTVWLAYLRTVTQNRRAGQWAIVLGAAATTMHPLAASVAVVFLITLLLPSVDRRRVRWALWGASILVLTLVAHREVSRLVWNATGPVAVPPAVANATVHLPGLGSLTLESARILVLDWFNSPIIGATVLAILALLLIGVCLTVDRLSRRTWISRMATAAWGLATIVNMPVVAALGGAWWIRLTAADRKEAIRRALAVAFLTAVSLVALVILTDTIGRSSFPLTRRAIAEILGVPEPWWMELAKAFPLMFGVTLVGSALIFLDSFDRGDDGSGLFVVATLFAPLVLMGFVESPYVQLRYLVHLNPLFVLAFVLSVRRLARPIRGVLRPSSDTVRTIALIIVCVSFAEQSRPPEGWGATQLRYGWNHERSRNPDVVSHFYFDVKTTGEYLSERVGQGDIVIARDGPATYVYARKVDFVLRKTPYDGVATARDGSIVDRNIGVPVLSSVERLEEALERPREGSVWIVASVPDGDRPIVNLPPGVPEWLKAREDRVVYLGRDGITRVYRFPPGDD